MLFFLVDVNLEEKVYDMEDMGVVGVKEIMLLWVKLVLMEWGVEMRVVKCGVVMVMEVMEMIVIV